MSNFLLSMRGLLMAVQQDTGLGNFQQQLFNLIDTAKFYIFGLLGAAAALWAIYIGLKIAQANSQEKEREAKKLVKNLIVGIVVIAVLAGLTGALLAYLNSQFAIAT
jgi:prolipoprotein diacylglyceryltransferase